MTPARCPRCSWSPTPETRWVCSPCEGTYDVVAAGAACPRCVWTLRETLCQGCWTWSAHAEWLTDPDVRAAYLRTAQPRSLWQDLTVDGVWRVARELATTPVAQLPSRAGTILGKALPDGPDWRRLQAALLEAERALATDPADPDRLSASARAHAACRQAGRELAAARVPPPERWRPGVDIRGGAEAPGPAGGPTLLRLAGEAWTSTRHAYERLVGDRGEAEIQAQDYRAAVLACDRVLAVDPLDAQALLNRGRALFLWGDFQAARDDYEASLRQQPEQPHTQLLVAYAASALGDWEATVAACEAYHRLRRSGRPSSYWLRAMARLWLGDVEEARRDLDEAVSMSDGDFLYVVHHCTLFEARGLPEDALATARQLAQRKPHRAEAHHQVACALTELGRPEEAVEVVTRALRLDPSFTDAYTLRGALNVILGDFEAAIRDAARAVALAPPHTRATAPRWLRLVLRWLAGDAAGARADLEAIAALQTAAADRAWLELWRRALGLPRSLLDGGDDVGLEAFAVPAEAEWTQALVDWLRDDLGDDELDDLAAERAAPRHADNRVAAAWTLCGLFAEQDGEPPWEAYRRSVERGAPHAIGVLLAGARLREHVSGSPFPTVDPRWFDENLAFPPWDPSSVPEPGAAASGSEAPEPAAASRPQAPAIAEASTGDLVGQLERLVALRDQGVLSDDEFAQLKRKLLFE